MTISRVGNSNDVTLTLPDGTTVTITDQFVAAYTGPYGVQWFDRIERIEFADETMWDAEYIMSRLIDEASTGGNDSIYGFSREDVLDGGAGDDFLSGGNEADTYVFARGYGDDTVHDQRGVAFSYGEGLNVDTLRLDGVYAADIKVERDATGDDIIIRVLDTNETVRIVNQVAESLVGSNPNEIEQIIFEDDAWTATDLRNEYMATAATSDDDIIRGFSTADTFDGGAGNDRLEGRGGGDTYHFGIGSGQDVINAHVILAPWDLPDTIVFGSGITPEMVSVARVGNNLVLALDGYSDKLTVENHFFGAPGIYDIEYFTFADSTVWTQTDIDARITTGTSGNDTLIGTSAPNTFIGGLGNDTMNGGIGSDTYIYEAGDGNDTIIEPGELAAHTDRLVFGSGLNSTDVVMTRSGYNSVTLAFNSVAGSVLLQDQFATGNVGIEQITFGDDVTWDKAAMRAAYLAQVSTSGNDSIEGFNGIDDTLQGGAGDDTLEGLTGNDTYVYNLGDGNDTIISNYQPTNTEILLLGSGLNSTDVQLTRGMTDLDDVTLSFSGVSGSIKLEEQFSATLNYGIEQIVFGDSVTWSKADLRAAYLAQMSTSGNDTIHGFNGIADAINAGSGDDVIYSLSGDDTISAGDGDDLIFGGAGADASDGGNGTDTVSYSNSTVPVTVNLASGTGSGGDAAGDTFTSIENVIGSTNHDTITGNAGNNVLDGGNGNDTISGGDGDDLILGGFGNDAMTGGSGTDTVSYAAATTYANVNLATGTGSNGYAAGDTYATIENVIGSGFADTLTGDGGANVLSGGAGNDTISGGDGDDVLIAGAGKDTMTGGADTDSFRFDTVADSVVGSNRDIITDFSHSDGDLIDLSAFAGTFSFIGTGSFTGTGSEVGYTQTGGNTIVRLDSNADGTADSEFQLTGLHTLVQADFVL